MATRLVSIKLLIRFDKNKGEICLSRFGSTKGAGYTTIACGAIPRYDLYQECKSEIPVRSAPQCHRGTPALQVQTHSYGIMFHSNGMISIKGTRERSPEWNEPLYHRGRPVPTWGMVFSSNAWDPCSNIWSRSYEAGFMVGTDRHILLQYDTGFNKQHLYSQTHKNNEFLTNGLT